MKLRTSDRGIVAVACAYLVALALLMGRTSYDVWGVLIALPVLGVLGYAGVRRMFRGDLAPLANVMLLGLAAKGVGAFARYWIAFDAYGGATDAQRYHTKGVVLANEIWRGDRSVFTIVPTGKGTAFMEHLTGSLYTVTGSSKLAGYLVFAFMSFWGMAWFVKAACRAIPGLERRRYALLCCFVPSLVYWPSSIGKEAWMMLTLGLGTYGIAMLLSTRRLVRPGVVIALGLGGAAIVRAHIAGLWLVGLLPAVLVAVLKGRGPRHIRGGGFVDRVMLVVVAVIAFAAIGAVGSTTVQYFQRGSDETSITSTNITEILIETTRRTSEAGSTYRPPSVASPLDWPKASVRTLVRPLLIEAHGIAQLASALELTALGCFCLANLRRLLDLPRLLLTNPYVAFAMTVLFFGGLAYASFANLGVLTRQKSLLFPFLLLLPCTPTRSRASSRHPAVVAASADLVPAR